MEYKFELEDRRIEAERLEKMSDRELLLLIAKKVTRPEQPAYRENVMGSIAEAILRTVHDSLNKRDSFGFRYMVKARCETTGTPELFQVPIEFDGAGIIENRDRAVAAAGKLADTICEQVKESELHRIVVDLVKCNDIALG